jgi:preprotein translocase subunit SecG
MQTVLIVIHLMVVIGLIVTVLLQRSEGGALGIGGGGGGTGGLFTGRGQANVLTRATAILAAIFFATSIALTVMASYGRAPKSIFEGINPPTAPAGQQPASGGGVLDQLKQLQQSPAAPPAAPAAPEPPRSQ